MLRRDHLSIAAPHAETAATSARAAAFSPAKAVSAAVLFFILTLPAQAQVTIFSEDFESLSGWTLETGWETSTSSASTGSGGNNLLHKGNAVAAAHTPAIDLSGATSATLSFLARRTGSYSPANLLVNASADGGETFAVIVLDTSEAVPATASTYQTITAELPAALIGSSDVVIRFEGRGLNASTANARIDDVTVTAVVALEVSPSSLQFFAAAGSTHEVSLTGTNRSGSALTVDPETSGTVFTVSPSSPSALTDGGSQAYTVTFAPASDGNFTGNLTLTHDLGSVVVPLTGATTGGSLGFSLATSEALENSSSIEIALKLDFSSEIGLQGLQFRITWTDAALSLTDITRGSAVSSTSNWSLAHEEGAGYVDVLLLGSGTDALTSAVYDPLLILRMASGSTVGTIQLTISNVIGALATPDGTDSGISTGIEMHELAIASRQAFFVASATSLDLGTAEVGQTSTDSVAVANTGGTADLVISAATSTNALFDVTPASATIQPNSQQVFVVSFTPEAASFGRQNATISFQHNAGQGVRAKYRLREGAAADRGDAEGDGTVDVLDVVHAIDFVLARLTPDSAQAAAADLFPFPAGDGALDVRDLTLLSQAIARGRWPDDVELPPVEEELGKGGVSLVIVEQTERDATTLTLEHEMSVRGLQLIIPAEREMTVEAVASGGMVLHSGYDGHRMRILMYRQDGAAAPAGVLRLIVSGRLDAPTYATLIGVERERIPVTVETGEMEEPVEDEIGPPYPNPFRSGVLTIPRADGARIYNVLGQLIWLTEAADPVWDGRSLTGDSVAPGIYLLEIHVGGRRSTWPFVIVR